MIKSKFILDVLEASLNYVGAEQIKNGGVAYWKFARPQVKFLKDAHYEYTENGLLVGFSYLDDALNHKSPVKAGVFSGVIIKSPDLKEYATTDIYFKDGIIDCLEIFSVDGGYPKKDLGKYSFHVLSADKTSNSLSQQEGKPLTNFRLLGKYLFKKKK